MTRSTKKDNAQGGCRNADDLIAELDRRLAEDDADPDDAVSWEVIRSEAQARYDSGMQMDSKLTVEQLKAAIAAGITSGKGKPADEVFNKLEAKYRQQANS